MSAPTPEEQAKAQEEANRQQAEAETQRAQQAVLDAAEASDDEDAEPADLAWFISNRKDDRVVLFEKDDQHPDGECFIGGSAPDFCARTPEVARLLREGLILEIPEPPDSRKKPLVGHTGKQSANYADAPGEPIRLGRVIDPELLGVSGKSAVEKQQRGKPDEVPVPAGVQRVRGPRTESAPK